MTPEEYLELATDPAYEAALRPHQEAMRSAVLAAEEEYQQALLVPPKFVGRASRMGRRGQWLLGYLYKWRDKDAEAALAERLARIEIQYEENTADISRLHDERVADRLAHYRSTV